MRPRRDVRAGIGELWGPGGDGAGGSGETRGGLSRRGLLGHTGAMPEKEKPPFLTAGRLARTRWLVHGFGRASWGERNLKAFAAARGMRPIIMRQLHSDIIHRLDGAPKRTLEGDALMTDVPGLLLVVRTADCLPVLLIDGRRRAVAAVHCGWRGTAKRILEKAVRAMTDAYGSKPGDLLAVLGPSIGAACYEVGPEVREAFLRAEFPHSVFVAGTGRREASSPRASSRPLLDLRAANVHLLEGAGVRPGRIVEVGSVCTHCDPALLSYRRDPSDPRRMPNFIGIC